jgi:hypothetical protein
MCGKKRQVRCSPKLIRIAMSLYLRDPKGHLEFQETDCHILPAPTCLNEIKSTFQMREGEDPKVCGRHKDERLRGKSRDGEVGHLMMDEIKLKSDVACNCRNKEIVGFVGKNDKISLRDEFAGLLESPEKKEEETKSLAVYANQWRFRSLYNKTHDAEFFFNSGCLNSDELLRQCLHAVTCYEMSGVEILGLVSDAGGPNSGLLKLLRHGESIESNWPSEKCVSVANHVNLDRTVSVWHCSAHNMKAMRNSLHRSQPGGTRDFHRESNIGFGWVAAGVRCSQKRQGQSCCGTCSPNGRINASRQIGQLWCHERHICKGAVQGKGDS